MTSPHDVTNLPIPSYPGRLKTGTPPRIDGRTIDYTGLEPQYADPTPVPFSYMNTKVALEGIFSGVLYFIPGYFLFYSGVLYIIPGYFYFYSGVFLFCSGVFLYYSGVFFLSRFFLYYSGDP